MFTQEEAKFLIELIDRAPIKGHQERALTSTIVQKVVTNFNAKGEKQNVENSSHTDA
ncbi:hypothetical protein vBAmePPT11V19_00007 [Alteromonas phage vB_AmeP_PT11-V19]|nr:hypothetical protein vBAmePPT11V19_00007 [Alteromonas phage vB_AmeP_PT11-V19]